MNNNHNNKPSGNRGGRRPLTREQAILAERRRAEKRQRQKETKMLIDKAVAVGILSIIGVAICLVIIFSYIFVDFRSHEKAPTTPLKLHTKKTKPLYSTRTIIPTKTENITYLLQSFRKYVHSLCTEIQRA